MRKQASGPIQIQSPEGGMYRVPEDTRANGLPSGNGEKRDPTAVTYMTTPVNGLRQRVAAAGRAFRTRDTKPTGSNAGNGTAGYANESRMQS